ncbi:hypothetical protein CCHL11_03265 [Colletotrichum chlorophyti]|uniref:Uncharacterized protein n=1 Tax=Colletotrichum chlorophyti TaxID=708187 RepID=A0A1Q8S489_9PEZI|nr:hypothetical protein CCHL11_03265 [Colletotrichum chlorophyti]
MERCSCQSFRRFYSAAARHDPPGAGRLSTLANEMPSHFVPFDTTRTLGFITLRTARALFCSRAKVCKLAGKKRLVGFSKAYLDLEISLTDLLTLVIPIRRFDTVEALA